MTMTVFMNKPLFGLSPLQYNTNFPKPSVTNHFTIYSFSHKLLLSALLHMCGCFHCCELKMKNELFLPKDKLEAMYVWTFHRTLSVSLETNLPCIKGHHLKS